MPVELKDTLVIGISATALFDLSEADLYFQTRLASDPETAIEDYRQFMLAREHTDLRPGTGMPLVQALLALNRHQNAADPAPLVEVVVMSRNSPETGMQVFHNIRRLGLGITRHAFTGGESVVDYLEAFDVDLFLTTNTDDAQRVINEGACAAAILKPVPSDLTETPADQVRLAFDGDAVLFDDSSELVYKTQGLDAFKASEDEQQDLPLPEGPYAHFLTKLSRLQQRLPFSVHQSPVRIAIVTARAAPAELRVLKTLRCWGVHVHNVFFLGGLEKAPVLKAFRPHIFFDDQDLHLDPASRYVSSGKVPYRSDSLLLKKTDS